MHLVLTFCCWICFCSNSEDFFCSSSFFLAASADFLLCCADNWGGGAWDWGGGGAMDWEVGGTRDWAGAVRDVGEGDALIAGGWRGTSDEGPCWFNGKWIFISITRIEYVHNVAIVMPDAYTVGIEGKTVGQFVLWHYYDNIIFSYVHLSWFDQI